jgi:phage terminase large subunit-like protein
VADRIDRGFEGAGRGGAGEPEAGRRRSRPPPPATAAVFESGEAKLARNFPKLEKQLAGLVLGGDYQGPGRSPDRADAMIWAMSELLLGPEQAEPRIRSF